MSPSQNPLKSDDLLFTVYAQTCPAGAFRFLEGVLVSPHAPSCMFRSSEHERNSTPQLRVLRKHFEEFWIYLCLEYGVALSNFHSFLFSGNWDAICGWQCKWPRLPTQRKRLPNSMRCQQSLWPKGHPWEHPRLQDVKGPSSYLRCVELLSLSRLWSQAYSLWSKMDTSWFLFLRKATETVAFFSVQISEVSHKLGPILQRRCFFYLKLNCLDCCRYLCVLVSAGCRATAVDVWKLDVSRSHKSYGFASLSFKTCMFHHVSSLLATHMA